METKYSLLCNTIKKVIGRSGANKADEKQMVKIFNDGNIVVHNKIGWYVGEPW